MSQKISDNIQITSLNHQLRRLNHVECTESVPAPNLSQLAVVRDLDDLAQAGLWLMLVQGQELVPLVTSQAMTRLTKSAVGAIIARPRWSADGQWLAFASYEGLPPGKGYRLWAVKAEAGSPPKLLYKGIDVIAAHLWSPDGACLAVADSGAGLVIVRPDGTSEVVDAEAMRYPLGENAMTWLNGGQRLLYMNLTPDKAGLWNLALAAGQKQQVVALSQDGIMIPADVNIKSQVAWGALQGNMRQRERGAVLYFWPVDGDKLEAIPLPNVEFDPASHLLPNDDGSLWAFTVWRGREGRRVPFVVDRPARRGRVLSVARVVTRMLGWSDAPRRLWVLLNPPQLAGLDVDQVTEPALPEGESFSVDLTPAELIYLLETLGGGAMVGLATPFAETVEDGAGQSREEAKAALISKGYVAVLPDGRTQMDLTVAALVQCCASPQQAWTTTFEDATGERDVRHIHRTQNLIVEDAILASGLHRLTPLRDDAAVLKRIEQQMHLKRQPAAPGQPFVLPEELLFRIREIAAAVGEKTAAQYLVRAGVMEATAAHFAQALAQPVSNSSVSRWSAIGEEVATSMEEIKAGIGILEGASGIWLLHPFAIEGAARIRVSPADATTSLEQITYLFEVVDQD